MESTESSPAASGANLIASSISRLSAYSLRLVRDLKQNVAPSTPAARQAEVGLLYLGLPESPFLAGVGAVFLVRLRLLLLLLLLLTGLLLFYFYKTLIMT